MLFFPVIGACACISTGKKHTLSEMHSDLIVRCLAGIMHVFVAKNVNLAWIQVSQAISLF